MVHDTNTCTSLYWREPSTLSENNNEGSIRLCYFSPVLMDLVFTFQTWPSFFPPSISSFMCFDTDNKQFIQRLLWGRWNDSSQRYTNFIKILQCFPELPYQSTKKLGDLKQQDLILFQVWRQKSKIKVSTKLSSSWKAKEKPSFAFQLPVARCSLVCFAFNFTHSLSSLSGSVRGFLIWKPVTRQGLFFPYDFTNYNYADPCGH